MLTTMRQFAGDREQRFTWLIEYYQGPAANETECFVTVGANLLKSGQALRDYLDEAGVSDDVRVLSVTNGQKQLTYQLD